MHHDKLFTHEMRVASGEVRLWRKEHIYSIQFENGLFLRVDPQDYPWAQELMNHFEEEQRAATRRIKKTLAWRWQRFWWLRRQKRKWRKRTYA